MNRVGSRIGVLSSLVAAVLASVSCAAARSPHPPVYPPQHAAPPAPRDWSLRFPAESWSLGASARGAVREAAAYANTAYSGRARVVAYGSPLRLAERRADAVAKALEASGLDRSRLETEARPSATRRTVIEVRFTEADQG